MSNQTWQVVDTELKLFKYGTHPPDNIKSCHPILMLHGTMASHRTWERLAQQLWDYGIENVYALDMPEAQMGVPINYTFEQLTQVIQYLLNEKHADAEALVCIGHGAGGIIAYRYWQAFEEEARFSYLFMLGAPHNATVFPLLREKIIRGNHKRDADESDEQKRRSTQSPVLDFTKVNTIQGPSSTVLVNIMGNQVEPDWDATLRGLRSSVHSHGIILNTGGEVFDGIVRGLYLPEAVNMILPLHIPNDHKDMNKDKRIGEAIITCLLGEFYQVKIKLVGIRLRGEDHDGYSGPVAFEINGNRMPPDSVFHGVTDRLYLFDEDVSPICTLCFPVTERSGTITLHLKDLSAQKSRRLRRMYVRLHIPLREANSTAHTMQDSEGSEYLWRLACQRIPTVLHDPNRATLPKKISRGI